VSKVDNIVDKPTPTSAVWSIPTLRVGMAGLAGAVAVVWFVFYLATDGVFLTDRNLVNLFRQTATTGIVAIGMLVVIAQGEIDLSVGSLLGLVATVVAMTESATGGSLLVSLPVAIGVGIACGMWNGFWVSFLGVPSFVVTLGGLMIFRGLSLVLSEGRTIAGIGVGIRFLGEGYLTGLAMFSVLAIGLAFAILPLLRLRDAAPKRRALYVWRTLMLVSALIALVWATMSYRGLPVPVAIALLLAGCIASVLDNTPWGRHVYAVGASRSASRIAGINIRRHLIGSFVLLGVICSVAAVLVAGRLGSVPPDAGQFLELNAIAAVVIGGASLYGGTGRVGGAVLGALLTQSLLNGFSLMNIPTAYQYGASGLVLMIAVFVDVLSKRGRHVFVRL
jgi:D-xylose transport system permease protein